MKTVLLIGTLDTKGREIAYLRDRLHEYGLATLVLDSGILDDPLDCVPDISRAEVAIAAEVPRPDGKGPALRLTGKIDRLAEDGDSVLIVDYKTNRPPPDAPDRVADAYLLQLAAYRLCIGRIFPGRPVRAAILWTDGPRIMEIPQAALDDYQHRLWQLDPASLDA